MTVRPNLYNYTERTVKSSGCGKWNNYYTTCIAEKAICVVQCNTQNILKKVVYMCSNLIGLQQTFYPQFILDHNNMRHNRSNLHIRKATFYDRPLFLTVP